MRSVRPLVRDRVLTLGLPAAREADLIEELTAQAEAIYADALEAGSTPEQAWEQALAVLPERRDFSGASWGSLTDWRFTWRLSWRQPGFFAAAVLTIALGIGACTAVFSVLEAVVLRPLAYREPDRLVMVWERFAGRAEENVVSPANFLDWRKRTNVFAALSPSVSMTRTLTGVGEAIEVSIEGVAWDYLRMLGVSPVLGRDLVEADDLQGTPPAVLLSHRIWQGQFGADRGIVGRRIRLDGVDAVVAGVLPADFRSLSEEPDMLTTARLDPAVDYRARYGRFMRAVGRLRDGVTLEAAQRELAAVAAQLEVEHPEFNTGWSTRVVPLAEHYSRRVRGSLWMMAGAVALVLLIVCGNVANLLLARAASREREFAIRAALGAPPARLARQLLLESLVLATTGGVLGCGLALWAIRVLRAAAPLEIPRLEDAGLDWRFVAIAVAATLLVTLLAGLAPALTAMRAQAAEVLKEGGRGLAGSRRGRAWRSAFVVAQVALASVLLAAAATLIGDFRKTLSVDTGFRPEGLLTASISLPGNKYRDPQRVTAFFEELQRRVGSMPEVRSVGAIAWLPLAGPGAATGFRVDGRPAPPPGQSPTTDVRMVTPSYFTTMGIPLKRGRLFGAETGQRFVVSEALARAMFPGEDPVGRRLIVSMRNHDAPGEILGVVGDVRHAGLDEEPRPMVYFPHDQFPMPWMTLVTRAHGDPRPLARSVVAMVRELDPEQPVTAVRTMEEWIGRSVAQQRFLSGVLSAFALVALLLALIGVHGVLGHMVEEQRHEIGIRMALGAGAAAVWWMVLRHGMSLVGGGLALGLLGCTLVGRIHPLGVTEIVSMVAAMLGLSLAAIARPAQRAIGLDPVRALRQE